MPLTVRGRMIPIRYAVAAVVLVVALVVAGVMTAPHSVGVEGSWEAPDPGGEVLGGRALVADGSNKALDLVSGTTITIGSVSGGDRRVAGGRLLILGADRLDAAALDATQRWTWKAPGEGTLTLLASTRTATVVRFCPTGSTAGAPCTLRGIGPTGGSIWTLTEPSSTAGQVASRPLLFCPRVHTPGPSSTRRPVAWSFGPQNGSSPSPTGPSGCSSRRGPGARSVAARASMHSRPR